MLIWGDLLYCWPLFSGLELIAKWFDSEGWSWDIVTWTFEPLLVTHEASTGTDAASKVEEFNET